MTAVNDAAARKAWALRVCGDAKMRLTRSRERILDLLVNQAMPICLDEIMLAGGIRDAMDRATVYRSLMLFCELEIIRQVSLPNKVSYFVLNVPGESRHFLICRGCGSITELPASESVAALEREVAAARSYTRVYHELVLVGLCPACQQTAASPVCAKVQPRMRRTGRLKSMDCP